jgi:hypothetical protein
VFAANTELEIGLAFLPRVVAICGARLRHQYQWKRRDRISKKPPLAVYSPMKRAPSSRLMPRVVWEIIGAKEKNSADSGDLAGAQGGAGNSIMVPTR